jgi:hypothetical protein
VCGAATGDLTRTFTYTMCSIYGSIAGVAPTRRWQRTPGSVRGREKSSSLPRPSADCSRRLDRLTSSMKFDMAASAAAHSRVAEADWLVRSGEAAIPARSKKESDRLQDMGADLGAQRFQVLSRQGPHEHRQKD